jgi:carbamoyl-phosphate synthase small subunit
VGRDLVKEVTAKEIYEWDPEGKESGTWKIGGKEKLSKPKYHVVAFDFGVKQNILRRLRQVGCRVTVVPAHTPIEKVLQLNPDGIFLSNGPGDPAALPYAAETVKKMIGKFPIFGICLGHQILSLAMGAKTYKLKFGHRGANQPALNRKTGQVEITVQNHGFAVDPDSLKGVPLEATHINLNDKTNEGVRHKELPIFSVQYHPEASPGPHDSAYLFEEFVKMMEENRK